MELGFKFLFPGKELPEITECNLDEIRHYLCPISMGDPLHCLDCNGFKGCTAGQRAAVLIDEETKGKQNEPMEEISEGVKNAGSIFMLQRGRRHCMEALASGNPVEYLVSHGMKRKWAINNISRWKKKYPDLFEGVIIPRNRLTAKSKEQREEENKRLYEECMQQQNPGKYLVEVKGIQLRSAWNCISLWRKQFGEVKPEAERRKEIEKPQEDEISLEDFLSQFGEQKQQERTLEEARKQETEILDQIAALQNRASELWEQLRQIRAELSELEREGAI